MNQLLGPAIVGVVFGAALIIRVNHKQSDELKRTQRSLETSRGMCADGTKARAQQNKVINGLKSDRWSQIDLIKSLTADRGQRLDIIKSLKTELEALQASKAGHLKAQVCKYKGDTTKRVERLGLCVIVKARGGFLARSAVYGLEGPVCATPTQAKRQFESLLGLSGRVNWGKK